MIKYDINIKYFNKNRVYYSIFFVKKVDKRF